MTLTVAKGPLGHAPGGIFNREVPREGLIYFEDYPRRIRAKFAGQTVVDSTRVKFLHEHGYLPLFYFPEEDLAAKLIEPSEKTTKCPYKGEASYWSVRVGDKVAENAIWSYLEPIKEAAHIAGYRSIYWNEMDEWFEEDEPAIVHARDHYHRVDILDTSRKVRVLLDGETLAETERARVLYETGLPPRWYIPREDVPAETLVDSDKQTGCAYKGFASYYSVKAGELDEEDLVWTYPDPRPEAERVTDYLCFFNERVDLEIDGELQERPYTPFSPDWKGPPVTPADR